MMITMRVKLLILVLVNMMILPGSKGQITIPVPRDVSACVIYEDNNISLNVQWSITAGFNSPSAFHTIYYFSNESGVAFNSSTVQPLVVSENNISDIPIPTNFTGQQIQIQVMLTFNSQESARSKPVIIDIRPVYLASYAINSTENTTTLMMGFNLACDTESGAACVVDIIPQNNLNMNQTQIHNFTDENILGNLFRPQQVFLAFLNITEGLEYMVQARLLSSERNMIGPEFQSIISVPFATEAPPEPTLVTTATAITTITASATTTVITTTAAAATAITTATTTETIQPPLPDQPITSDAIQPTSTERMVTSTITERSTTVSNTPTLARDNLDSESTDSSNIGIAIGVSIGCLLLLALAITLCIIIILIRRNDKRKKNPSKESADYSIPEELSFNRYSYNSTTVLHNASAGQDRNSYQGRSSQKHDYSLPTDANYTLYEETPQIGNSKSNNPIPSHYETAENQDVQILPFLSNGHYEMSDTVIQNPAPFENVDYNELIHNSHQNDNDIPPVPSGAYDYDQLGQSAKTENKNTDKQHYYDSLTNVEYISYQNMQEGNGYTELQDSTANQSKPYQSLTNSNRIRYHQYEEVKEDKATVPVEGNYSEPYNVKNKKLLPNHQYDVVTGDANPLPKRSFVREYSEPRDTLNIFH